MQYGKILYIGQMIDPHKKKEYTGASSAGVEFEWNLVNSLANQGIAIDVVSIAPIASFPKDKRIIYKHREFPISDRVKIYYTGFVNLPLIKQVSQIVMSYFAARKITKENNYDHILSYNTYPQVGLPAYWLSSHKKLKHTCVVADLPFNDRKEQSFLNKISWKVFGGIAWRLLSKIKSFVLLNENAREFIPSDSKYCIVEGGINPQNYIYKNEYRFDEFGRKIILFSGALTQYSGIITLCNAVKKLPADEFVLHIYGNGDLLKEIKQIEKYTQSIKYCGVVPIEQIRKIQANSWLLVNPRATNDSISKYTFPSKILEYMASGTSVLTTRISGLTNDYLGKLFVCDGYSSIDLASEIVSISNIGEDRGKIGRDFVFHCKSWESQSSKIVEFLNRDW